MRLFILMEMDGPLKGYKTLPEATIKLYYFKNIK
jgi:hypothetical protein